MAQRSGISAGLFCPGRKSAARQRLQQRWRALKGHFAGSGHRAQHQHAVGRVLGYGHLHGEVVVVARQRRRNGFARLGARQSVEQDVACQRQA